MKTVVSCVMPRSPAAEPLFEAASSFYSATADPNVGVAHNTATSSLLPDCFNSLWVDTLNRRQSHGFTHFAMHHSDVVAEAGWLDVLLKEMDKYKADLISVVIPQRARHGRTSTAVTTSDPFRPYVLSLKEIFDQPETFTMGGLLVNTGLMLVRLTGDHLHPMPFFSIVSGVKLNKEGKWENQVFPEDWSFSNQIQAANGRVYATRKVKVWHGRKEFHNESPWGEDV